MLVFDTAEYVPERSSADVRHWIYNGLDACVTGEILPKLLTKFTPNDRWVYEFELRLCDLAMKMMLHGVRVDDQARRRLILEYDSEKERLEEFLNWMGDAIWGKPLNARSPAQLKDFFYERMGIPSIYKKDKYGERRPTTNEKALLKIADYIRARPIANTILAIREIGGFLTVLHSGVDGDDRMRFELSPASTETGRWASRKNAAGGGQNAQNITDRMRRIFIPDDGFFFAYADLEQAESRVVAYYADDEKYIAACEQTDLHSGVSQMIWPGADPKSPWRRHFTKRDMSKKCGHASNYKGSAYGISQTTGIEEKLVEDFQLEYFSTFPGIPRWHASIAQELQSQGYLETIFGRTRHFFDRLDADGTIKEAIAHKPQSTVVDYLSKGLIAVDESLAGPDFQTLLQIHDAALFQIRLGREDLLERARSLMRVEVEFPSGKKMIIPNAAKVGFNWGEETTDNPNGLGKSLAGKRLEIDSILRAVL